ncbi:hypothetical protein KCM76_22130 [Zooshikella marina]|uniref:hypothetical protein n=1 Tax=Zooshikella ganghwensis TaxID=202772 RepID=UPI001BB065A5|nr:hypothetical protein [Zooshikella ganghwensis]MBU2708707.1 hypothetical protein [Zooshikella ganghwensis]
MGLFVSVGLYSDLLQNDAEGAGLLKRGFEDLNAVLRKNGIEQHIEPEATFYLNNRSACKSFSYSYLHYLRRFYANIIETPDWRPMPVSDGVDPATDTVLEEQMMMFSSHLLCHSDCEGFYLPIKFNDILVGDKVPGGLLGSSYMLFKELIEIAPKLGIELENGELSDQEAQRINLINESNSSFYREYCVWIALYEAARLSIKHKSAISFC